MTTDEQDRFATLTDRCHRLVRFLHELAASTTATVDDVDEHSLVIWLDDLPAGLSLFDQARSGEILLSAPADSALPPRPAPPPELAGRVEIPAPGELPSDLDPPLLPAAPDHGTHLPWRDQGTAEPALTEPDPTEADLTEPDPIEPLLTEPDHAVGRAGQDIDESAVLAAYERWLPTWRIWASRAREDAERRAIHNVLYGVTQQLAQAGDAFELVLATGLLSWGAVPEGDPRGSHQDGSHPGGQTSYNPAATGEVHSTEAGHPGSVDPGSVHPASSGTVERGLRRHLLTTRLSVDVDPVTSVVRLRLPADASTRLEDATLLDGVPAFRPERTNALHERLRARQAAPLGGEDERLLRDWLTLALDTPTGGYSPSWQVPAQRPERPTITLAPALVLRNRGRATLLNYYEQMMDALRGDGRPPLGLVQLVETLEADERLAWLVAEGATSGAQLGEDPLFPLPANPEQARVMRRLRHDNGVVVEGPPGTGKTHTIANLVCALLAQGQRVLVTSQKAQALRVLREKLPPELQRLCVSLTDVSDTGSAELTASVSALAAEKAAYDPAHHRERIALARLRREEATARGEALGEQARAARQAERVTHPAGSVAPGWPSATRAEIASRVRRDRTDLDWMPLPIPRPGPPPGRLTGSSHSSRSAADWPPVSPLSSAEAETLRALLRSRSPSRAGRLRQAPVDMAALVPPATLRALLDAERAATEQARAARGTLGNGAGRLFDQLALMTEAQLDPLRQAASGVVDALGRVARQSVRHNWVPGAVDDVLGGRDALLWDRAAAASALVHQAQDCLATVGLRDVELPPSPEPADMAGMLAAARGLRKHVEAGGSLRRAFRPRPQKEAARLLDTVTVDGASPATAELLAAVEAALSAEVALAGAAKAWSMVGVQVDTTAAPQVRAARLADTQAALDAVAGVVGAREDARAVLADIGTAAAADVAADLDSAQACRDLSAAVTAARLRCEAEAATDRLRAVHDAVARASRAAPPEFAALADALADRDVTAYSRALAALAEALTEQADELRCAEFSRRLQNAHPELWQWLLSEIDDDAWDARLRRFDEAWSWACATTWLSQDRLGDAPTPAWSPASVAGELDVRLDAAEDAVAAATADLASALAWQHCLERMGSTQAAALRTYADAVAALGSMSGPHADRFRQAAREAMTIAQAAVPAWVMPINEVLSTVPAVRDSFDVVIVDEGSQAGLDSLFLLWLAPRVIVVGDDRQCTPAEATADETSTVFGRLDSLLPDVPGWLRVSFTPRSSLFTLLRTRFGEVIRLREHFRCMPEIIEWSSAMFYRDAPLVPLRQFGADRLAPLRSRFVPHAYAVPSVSGLRNPAEAEALVAQVLACAADPAYDGRSFGIVVLQGSAQADLVRSRLTGRMSAAEQQRRRLRVGTPPDFQGDERDVVFLSLVVAPDGPNVALTRLEYQRRFNVAASRARDQVWLFTSVSVDDLDPADLRHSYLSYVLARTAAAPARSGWPGRPVPRPRDVRQDVPHPSFDSLFEQQVFLALADRGFLAAPQAEVNGRRIDLVVAGGRARLAVQCDGDVAVPAEQLLSEFARDRELRRAGWPIQRILRSDFELDPEAALAPLWAALDRAGIEPAAADPIVAGELVPAGASADAAVRSDAGDDAIHRWHPITLSDLEGLDDAAPPEADARRPDPAVL